MNTPIRATRPTAAQARTRTRAEFRAPRVQRLELPSRRGLGDRVRPGRLSHRGDRRQHRQDQRGGTRGRELPGGGHRAVDLRPDRCAPGRHGDPHRPHRPEDLRRPDQGPGEALPALDRRRRPWTSKRRTATRSATTTPTRTAPTPAPAGPCALTVAAGRSAVLSFCSARAPDGWPARIDSPAGHHPVSQPWFGSRRLRAAP